MSLQGPWLIIYFLVRTLESNSIAGRFQTRRHFFFKSSWCLNSITFLCPWLPLISARLAVMSNQESSKDGPDNHLIANSNRRHAYKINQRPQSESYLSLYTWRIVQTWTWWWITMLKIVAINKFFCWHFSAFSRFGGKKQKPLVCCPKRDLNGVYCLRSKQELQPISPPAEGIDENILGKDFP